MSYVLSKLIESAGKTAYVASSMPWAVLMTWNKEEAKSFRTKKEATAYAKYLGHTYVIEKV